MGLWNSDSYKQNKKVTNWHLLINSAWDSLRDFMGDKGAFASLASWIGVVETDKNAVKTEVTNARGNKTTLTARLDVEHNADGTHTASASTPVDWKNSGHTPVYLSSSSFKVATQDVTGTYVAGRRLKITLGSGAVYCTVKSASFATDTTITIEETNLDNTISAVAYGVVTSGSTGSIPKHDHSSDAQGGVSDDLVRAIMDLFNVMSQAMVDHGKDVLLMIDGWADTFTDGATQNNTAVDLTGSTGATHDNTNKLWKNTPGAAGQTSNIVFTTESDYLQQEWTNTNQVTSQATATNGSAVVTIPSGVWPTNAAKARISFDSGTTWYDVSTRDTDTQLTLASNFTGTTGAYNWTLRMSEFSSGAIQLNANVNITENAVVQDTNAPIYGATGSEEAYGQNFQVNQSQNITGCILKLAKVGSPTDNFKIQLFASTTPTASGGLPTGSALATTADISAASLTTTLTENTSTFVTPYTPTTGNWYFFTLERTGARDTVNYVIFGKSSTDVHPGRFIYKASGIWDGILGEFFFKIIQGTNNVITEYVSASSSYANRVDTSAWSDINSLARTETLNSQSVYYWLIDNPAASFGAGTTAKIWNATGGVWRNIARNNAGTWQYNNDATATASETWVNSTVNDMLHAISKAVSLQVNNRMTGAQMAAVTDGNLTAPATSQVVGVTLQSSLTSQNPSVDNIAANYDSLAAQISLVSRAFGGANMPPAPATAPTKLFLHVIDKQISGTPVYEVSRDGGTSWTAVTWDKVNVLADGVSAQRYAQVDVSAQPAATSPKCRVRQTALSQSLEIHDLGLQYK